jgi:hypothetical protein
VSPFLNLWDSISGEAGLPTIRLRCGATAVLFADWLDHGDAREATLRVAHPLEREPTAIGVCAHLLAVERRLA